MDIFEQGSDLDGYVVDRCAAVGAMCRVYHATRSDAQSSVAIKVLDPLWIANDQLRGRFANEVTMLHSIRHTHVVSFLGSGTLRNGLPYVILEWVPFNLQIVLHARGQPLEHAAALRLGMQIAQALQHLHDRGIVHRDIKAGNVLLDVDDPLHAHARLADLGLAKWNAGQGVEPVVLTHVSTGARTLLGTWEYMAPEQWLKTKWVDAKADVYSLGVLFFEMLAGRLPFIAKSEKKLMGLHLLDEPPMHLLGQQTSYTWRNLITRMLDKDASGRPSMNEVVEQLATMQTNLK